MTKEQHAKLMGACAPVALIALNAGTPRSPQENANAAWDSLGEELGFIGRTARPVPGKSDHFFTAEARDD